MNIAILGARGMPSTYGGYETFIQELAPALVARGHQVTVYCRQSVFRERPRWHKGVRLVYLPSIETKNLGTLTHTAIATAHVLMNDVDIVFMVNPANGWYCLPLRLLGKKVAINLNGLEWKRGKWNLLGKLYFRWAARAATLFASELINDSEAMRKYYLDMWKRDSTFIPYGAWLESSRQPEILQEYGLKTREYFLILSRLVPENNAELIIKAFEDVKTSFALAIGGDATYRSRFAEDVKKTKDKRVFFLGHIGHNAHAKELFCNSYAYIHGHEVGGTNPSLLTALGCGTCVLALNTLFSKEVLQDYGIMFEKTVESLRDKLQYIVDKPQIAECFRQRARERISQAYMWESVFNRYESIFIKMLK